MIWVVALIELVAVITVFTAKSKLVTNVAATIVVAATLVILLAVG